MPLENATYIGDLNTSLPLGTDAVSSADDHIRLIKAVLKATFPNLNGPISLSSTALNGGSVPTGFIGLWSGASTAIPSGWLLCDGANGTPDLRDRFVVGAGSTYAVGAKGGANTATTATGGSHTHTANSGGAHTHTGQAAGHALTIAELPAHHHIAPWGESQAGDAAFGVAGSTGFAGSGQTDHDNYQFNTSDIGGGAAHSHSLTIDSSGLHTHTLVAGGDHSHTVDTRSPYYALCYIMKG